MAVIIFVVTVLFCERLCEVVSTLQPLECPLNHFKIRGMESCHRWITCEDIDNITVIKRLGTGAVKDVFLVNWKVFSIVLSVPVNNLFLEDFMNGVETLKLLNPSEYIVQFLGFCDKKYALMTEYYSLGNAAEFFSTRLLENNNLILSLGFCHQYSLILNYLQNGPAGRRVFCDSNTLEKLLSQLLVTSDIKLILNDVDALPEVINGTGIKCGHRELTGSFVAPEQLWARSDEFSDDLMPVYNEKTDIWKAAAVCDFFLNRADGGEIVKYRLFELHSKCRSLNPSSRPTTEELVKSYSSAIEDFGNHSEL